MSEHDVAAFDQPSDGTSRQSGDGACGGEGVADCEETVRRLYTFLDGELTEDRREAINAHLDGCGDCAEVLGFETELRHVVADRCKDHVPEPLKERIAAAIRREEQARSAGRTGDAAPT